MRTTKNSKKFLLLLLFFLFLNLSVNVHQNHFFYAAEVANMGSANTYIKNGQIVEESHYEYHDDFKMIVPVSPWQNRYIDYARGYSINYPNHMELDISLAKVKTVISDENTQIEIYYDNFTNTVHSANSYINYSNKFKYNWRDHQINMDTFYNINGMRTHVLLWQRPKLKHIENDRNYYAKASYISSQNEVYTVFIKSNQAIANYQEIFNSFTRQEKKATAKISRDFKWSKQNFSRMNQATRLLLSEKFLDSQELKWGIFEYTTEYDFYYLSQLEGKMDYKFDFIVRYKHLEDPFPKNEMQRAHNNLKTVQLTMQTNNELHDYAVFPGVMYAILNGDYDDYFIQYAKDIKEFSHPVLFRLNNEMNGDWCVYSAFFTANDTEIFKAVWKHIFNIFQAQGVDNLIWVWNPHDKSFPDFAWNHALNYYPGDEYVDIIGLTGYNPGTYFKGEKWREFTEIYDPLYAEYSEIFDYPFIITEFASANLGGDKMAWIEDMFANMPRYKNIKVAIWWNGIDWDQYANPGRVYRLDENEAMLAAFRQGLSQYKP